MKLVFVLALLAASTAARAELPNEIVFTGNDRIYVIGADGTGQTAITAPALGTDRPRWSRDGRQIVFTKGNLVDFSSSIWKMNADGSNLTLVLSVDGGYGFVPWQPVFSPRADRIAYVGCNCFDPDDAIFIANADGSNSVWVTNLFSYAYGLDWAATGERLVYSEYVFPQSFFRISSINTNGTNNLVLTSMAQGNNFDPV